MHCELAQFLLVQSQNIHERLTIPQLSASHQRERFSTITPHHPCSSTVHCCLPCIIKPNCSKIHFNSCSGALCLGVWWEEKYSLIIRFPIELDWSLAQLHHCSSGLGKWYAPDSLRNSGLDKWTTCHFGSRVSSIYLYTKLGSLTASV